MSERGDLVAMRTPLPRLVAARLRAEGKDARALCERYGLRWEAIEEPSLVAPVEALAAFYDGAAAALGDPDLGLHVAANVPRGAYGLFEFGVRASATLREGLDRLCQGMAMFNRVVQLSWSTSSRLGRCELVVPGRAGALGRQGNEFFVGLLVAGIRGLLQQPFAATRVWFCHRAPASIQTHRDVLGCDEIRFDASTCGFEFEAKWLDQPLNEADPELTSAIDQHVRVSVTPAEPVLVFELRRTLRELEQMDTAALFPIARKMGHSTRSLQRHLQAHGTSFRQVVEEVRKERMRNLEQEGVPTEQIANKLGYRDVAALRRAQRRWS